MEDDLLQLLYIFYSFQGLPCFKMGRPLKLVIGQLVELNEFILKALYYVDERSFTNKNYYPSVKVSIIDDLQLN